MVFCKQICEDCPQVKLFKAGLVAKEDRKVWLSVVMRHVLIFREKDLRVWFSHIAIGHKFAMPFPSGRSPQCLVRVRKRSELNKATYWHLKLSSCRWTGFVCQPWQHAHIYSLSLFLSFSLSFSFSLSLSVTLLLSFTLRLSQIVSISLRHFQLSCICPHVWTVRWPAITSFIFLCLNIDESYSARSTVACATLSRTNHVVDIWDGGRVHHMIHCSCWQ